MSTGKRRRGELDSYPSGSVHTPTTTRYPYNSQPPYASGSAASVSSSRLLNLLDGVYEEAEKPRAKKARKEKKDANTPVPEKRAARFKKACPQNIVDRVERVLSQRFFLIDRKREGQELREEFTVYGSTGNAYTVQIDKLPSCNCPDALKGNHCKHILFIFLKVLQVPQRSSHWYQKALLESELEEIFRDAPPAPNSVASEQVRNAYAQATGKVSSTQVATSSKEKRIPVEGDDCPVCYEPMHNESSSKLVWCDECRKPLHKECFQQWANSKPGSVTCVWCRAPWAGSRPNNNAGGVVQRSREGYINLSGVAGLSPIRDTSTYYHGPRRGKHYLGYQDYDY